MEDSVDSAWDSESASAVVRVIEKGSHQFVVKNNYKGIGVDEAIESEEFTVAGLLWNIRFYPAGKTTDACNSGFVSLHIQLKSHVTYPVPCLLIEMHFVDQSSKGNYKGRSFSKSDGISYVESGCSIGCNNFVKRDSLESSHCLKDDSFQIRVTFGVFTSHYQNLPPITVPKSNIGEVFGRLLQSKKGADVFFKVNNRSFCAHKWVLTARCPKLLSSGIDTSVIDMEPDIFKALLWFVYTGTLPEELHGDSDFGPLIIESFTGKMLSAADRFEFKRLKKICELRLSRKISAETAPYLLHLSEICRARELKEASLRFGAENGARLLDVMDSDGCKYLKERCPLLYLELAYEESYPANNVNGNQEHEHDLSNEMLSAVKESFAGMLSPRCATTEKHHKIKKV